MFWLVLVLGLVFHLVGYLDGWQDGRAAERKSVRFTPVDKLEPREGYQASSHYCPPLNDARWELDDHVYKPQENSRPKVQGYTRGSDPYRYYEVEDL